LQKQIGNRKQKKETILRSEDFLLRNVIPLRTIYFVLKFKIGYYFMCHVQKIFKESHVYKLYIKRHTKYKVHKIIKFDLDANYKSSK